MTDEKKQKNGAILMLIAGIAFIGYGLAFLYRNFFGDGFELGVDTLGDLSRADLIISNPELFSYISHLHVATAGFIIAAGIATAFLSWYGVRKGMGWAWVAAVLTPVSGLLIALPMHYLNLFGHDWVTHLGPIYLAVLIFVIGALMSLPGVMKKSKSLT